MAEVGDELDIVLDDQEGLAGAVELGQRHLDLADAGRVDAGHRLVEHDDLGMRHQGRGQRHQLLLAVGQDAGLDLPVALQPDQLDQLARPRLGLVDGLAIAPGAQELVDPGGGIELLGGDREVVAQAQPLVDAHRLEGAHQAGAGDVMGGLAGDVVARQHDLAAVELLEARDAVDGRALARAVGADQAGDAAGLDRERDAVQRMHAGVGLAQVGDLEDRAHRSCSRMRASWRSRSQPATPVGMTNMATTRITP